MESQQDSSEEVDKRGAHVSQGPVARARMSGYEPGQERGRTHRTRRLAGAGPVNTILWVMFEQHDLRFGTG